MVRMSKKCVLLLLLTTVLISVALRYPLVDHERHNDTYLIRQLASSIIQNDRAVWIFHPLSYFGYYPASYPSGVPFLLAEFSDLTGMGLSPSILALNMFVGVMFALMMFSLTRMFVLRVDYALLAAFLATLGPRFVDASYWNGSARPPFLVIAILAVILAKRAGSSGNHTYLLLAAVAIVGCFATHHMAVLLILFGIAYVLSILTVNVASRRGRRVRSARPDRWVVGAVVGAFTVLILFISFFAFDYFRRELEYSYASTSWFSFEPKYLSVTLNLVGSYVNQVGPILPIAVIGIPFCLSRMRITLCVIYPVFLMMSLIPLLPSAQYVAIVILPFVAILASYAFAIALGKERRRRAALALLVVVIATSLILPVVSALRWNGAKELSGDATVPDNQMFSDAAYLRQYAGKSAAICNSLVLSSRLGGASDLVFLDSGVRSALSGDVNAEIVAENVTWMKARFPYNLYRWLEYREDERIEVLVIMYILQGNAYPAGPSDVFQSGTEYFQLHQKILVVVDNRWPESFTWTYAVLSAKLPGELFAAQWKAGSQVIPLESYAIYSSQRVTLFATEVPGNYSGR